MLIYNLLCFKNIIFMEFNKTLPSIYSPTSFTVSQTSGGDAYTVPTFGTVDLATALVTGNAAFIATLSLN